MSSRSFGFKSVKLVIIKSYEMYLKSHNELKTQRDSPAQEASERLVSSVCSISTSSSRRTHEQKQFSVLEFYTLPGFHILFSHIPGDICEEMWSGSQCARVEHQARAMYSDRDSLSTFSLSYPRMPLNHLEQRESKYQNQVLGRDFQNDGK